MTGCPICRFRFQHPQYSSTTRIDHVRHRGEGMSTVRSKLYFVYADAVDVWHLESPYGESVDFAAGQVIGIAEVAESLAGSAGMTTT